MAYTDIDDPSAYFQTTLYTGNGQAGHAITNSGNSDLAPNWVWIKQRNGTGTHRITDSVRGVQDEFIANDSIAEDTNGGGLSAFGSDGFTLGDSGAYNGNNNTYVSWNWKAGTSVSGNTTGSGTAKAYSGSVSADAGFSIITYLGNGTAGHTIPHHLGVVPQMIIVKERANANSWYVYHHSLGNTKNLYLNGTHAAQTDGVWNDTTPTSSVFTLVDGAPVNRNDGTTVAYCFAEKKGYLKTGKWIGNGNNDGPFSYTGFKPAFILIKRTDTAKNWYINDNLRLGYNVNNPYLSPNLTAAETGGTEIDILSNGFKIRASGTGHNQTGGTYIFMAIAENPFVTSTGVPATAK